MHYKLEVKQEYVYGPYYIRNNGVGWYWGHATRDIQDERVFGNPGSAAHAIDEWEVHEKQTAAQYDIRDTEARKMQEVRAEAIAKRMGATFIPNASVPEQERYEPVDYATSPPPMDQYPKPYKAPDILEAKGVDDYMRKIAKSIEDYVNERWS